MGKTIKLASVLLKCGLGSGTTDSQKKSLTGTVNPVVLICLIPVMYYLFRGGIMLQEFLGVLDQEGLILGFLLFLISSFIFCTGIATCINSFYLSSNLNTLLVMPYTSMQITGAKFIVAAVYEYGITLALLAPVLAGYGYSMHAPVSFWTGAVLSVLFLPAAPLAYAAVISMIVMRFIGRAKNRELMTGLGAFAMFALTVLYQIVREGTKGMKMETMEEAVAHMARSLKGATSVFPDIPFLVQVMVKGDWLSALWSVLCVVAILAVFLFAAKFLYLSGAVGMQDTSESHKKMTVRQLERESRNTDIVWSYTRKELRTILRTPAYYMNCLFLTLGWPLIVILPALYSKTGTSEMTWLDMIVKQSDSGAYFIFILFCAVLGITVFAATTNAIAPTAISREGQSFYVMKQLPVVYKKQLKAKQNAALIICWTGSGAYMVLGELFLIFLKGFPWWSILLTLVFNILFLYIIVDLGMIYGLAKPKLVWESEAEVSNQGKAGFVFFLLGVVIDCILIFGLGGWAKALTCSPWIFAAGLCTILAVIAFVTNRIFYTYGKNRLEKL